MGLSLEDVMDKRNNVRFTREEVKRELRRHSADYAEFIEDMGDKEEYKGWQVLQWLGY